MKQASRSAKSATKAARTTAGFTDEERAAIQDRAREQKAAVRRGARGGDADLEGEVLAKIAEMGEGDRAMAERLHALVKTRLPDLSPRLWYGMPAYAKGGNVICFFQPARKFKTRYATLGFSDKAHLDDGGMWPTYYALMEWTGAIETRIAALLKQAAR